MRKDLTIVAAPRETRGKNEARRLRVQKLIPAVVYGIGKDPVAVSVDPKEISKVLNSSSGSNTIFNLDVTGVENSPVLVKDFQVHPLKSNLLHVDLQRIDLTKRLNVSVRVRTTGEPRGVKEQGGVYEIVTRAIEIECLPDEIPAEFVVDVLDFMIGSNLRAGDVELSGSMKLVSPADQVISHVIAPARVEEEAAATEEPKAAEPEVAKKGKKEEDEAAAKEAEGKKKK
jgi:large subunit ribosomal protein L25